MRLPQHQQVAGLGDVLRRGAPMHPAAMRLPDDTGKLPHQRHDGVPGASEPLVDPRAVQQFHPRPARNRLGGIARNDAQLGLRPGQRDLHVQPGLPAILQAIQRPDAGIRYACRSWKLIAHGAPPGWLRPLGL